MCSRKAICVYSIFFCRYKRVCSFLSLFTPMRSTSTQSYAARITVATYACILVFGSLSASLFSETARAAGETCNGLPATIVGTTGNDSIQGTDNDDVIVTLGGNDTIDGYGGNDTICAGDGDDTVEGGNGNDWINGEDGNDTLDTGNGEDTVYGGNGNDEIETGSGNDSAYGGAGNDTLDTEGDDDLLDGGADTDSCDGGTGTDTLINCENGSNVTSSSSSSAASSVSSSSVSSASSVSSSSASSANSSASSVSSTSSSSSSSLLCPAFSSLPTVLGCSIVCAIDSNGCPALPCNLVCSSSSVSSSVSSSSSSSVSMGSSSSSVSSGGLGGAGGGGGSQFFGITVPVQSETGSYRGWRTNTLKGVSQFLAIFNLGSARVAPAAFGGSEEAPLSDNEKKYLCSMMRALPEQMAPDMLEWMSETLAETMNRDADFVLAALERGDVCPAKTVQASVQLISAAQPVTVDSKGVPLSVDSLWNKCIRGERVTLQDIRDSGNMTCAKYHTKESWFYPDQQIYIWYDRSANELQLPEGYVPYAVLTTASL
jgi:hypothetical protein